MSDDKQKPEDLKKKKAEPDVEAEAAEGVAQTKWVPRSQKFVQDVEEAQPVPLWLITFTDIMALMLTFFVMMYTMSVPLEEKWEELTTAFDTGFSKFQSPQWNAGPQDTISIDKLDFSRALDLDYLESVVEEIIASDEKLKNVVVISQDDRLILSLPSELLFEAGQAEVTVEGKRAIFSLGGPLSRIRNRIEVVGHTDPRPIENKGGNGFNTNWDLSLMRAAHVAAVLENVGYTRSITLRGLASGRYAELPDLQQEERFSLARRVDVVIMKDDGSQRLGGAVFQ